MDLRKMRWRSPCARIVGGLTALAVLPPAHASFLSGEALDTAANVLAWIILLIVPPIVIALFWIVHVLPEKIAEKRHHPNKEGIHVLCLLSLFFGGMLWPFAWLWAYTRPVIHKMAYGTEKHEDYYVEQAELAVTGKLAEEHLLHLRAELEQLRARGLLTPELKEAYARLQAPMGHAAAADTGVGVR